MPCILTKEERSRLEKLVGMLGSEFDGERANAAAVIKRMADGKRVTLVDLLMRATVEGERPSSGYKQDFEQAYARAQAEAAARKRAQKTGWQADLQAAVEAHKSGPRFMTSWEEKFAADILARGWPDLSDKQRTCVDKILDKHQRLRKAQADFG